MGASLKHLGQCVSLHLPRALLAVVDETQNGTTASVPSLPPRHPPPRPSSANTLRPGIAVIVGVLITMLSITLLLLLYAKHCRRTVGRAYGGRRPGVSFLGGGGANSGRRNSGVDRTVVESLPVFRFGSLRGRKEGLECAVCLGRFNPEELLRLLPKCRHAFHVECVDTWLDAHSTCPICRHRVDPEDVLLAFHEYEPPASPKPHPAADAEGPSKLQEVVACAAAAPPTTHSPAAVGFRFFRAGRVSGRHSSAGEKRSDSALQVVIHRANSDAPAKEPSRASDFPSEEGYFTAPTWRNSADNALMMRGAAMPAKLTSVGCLDGRGAGVRKDRLLLTDSAMQRRFGHRIVVSGDGDLGGGAVPRRWSDTRPQDLLLLRREMILADGCRASSCSSSAASCGADGGTIGARSLSEITGLSRFAAAPGCGAAAATAEGRSGEQRMLRRWLALGSKGAGRWLQPGGPGC